MKLRIIPASFKLRVLLGFSMLIFLFLGTMVAVETMGIPGTANKGKAARYRAQTLSDLELVSGLFSQQIAGWYRERRMDVDGLASSPCLRQALETHSVQANRNLSSELDAFRMSHPTCQFVALVDPADAAVRAASGGHASVGCAADLGIGPERFSQLIIPGYLETIEINVAADKKPRLRIMRQVLSPSTPDKIIAVLVGECGIEGALRPLIGSVNSLLSKDWQCVIVSKGGGLVTLVRNDIPEPQDAGALHREVTSLAPIRLAISGIEGPYDGPDQNGDPVLAFHRQIKFDQGIALALALTMERALAHQPAQEDLVRQGILWLAMFIVGIGLCVVLSNQISKPINGLIVVARRIESGDLTGRVAANDSSEIGRFAAVFNGMVARLQTLHQNLEKQVLERTRELRILSERQGGILTAAPDIIVEVGADKVYTWANRAGRGFFGEDVIGQPAASYCEGEQDPGSLHQAPGEGAGEVPYVESWQRRKDGQIRLLAWWSRPLKDDQGRQTSVISTARDVTDQRRAEETLKQKYAELELFHHATTDRELRMIELKREINALLQAANQPEKYRVVTDG